MPSFFKKKGPTQLFELIMNEKWEDSTNRSTHHPSEVKRWTKVCIDGTHSSSLLPLHQAVSLKPPVKAVNALVKAYPKAVRTKESFFFRLPLHIACLRGASLDVISALLLCYPDGARAKAVFDRLPIHYACGSGGTRAILTALVDSYPDGPRTQDEHGWLPLHLACFYNAAEDVVQLLLESYPESVLVTTKKGKTPIQCIKNKQRRNEKVVSLLQGAAAFRKEAKALQRQARKEQRESGGYTGDDQSDADSTAGASVVSAVSAVSTGSGRSFRSTGPDRGRPRYGLRSRTSSFSSMESDYDFVPSDNDVC